MRVFDVRKTTGLQTFWSKWSTWVVYIQDVDTENNMVFASWSGNPPEWYSERIWCKWRLKRPAPERI